MKILVITSDQPRHRYFAQAVKSVFSGVVKTLAISKSKMHFTNRSAGLFADHQAQYNEMEKRVFALDHSKEVRSIDREMINDTSFIQNCLSENFDLILVFGSPILHSDWIVSQPTVPKVNFHLGYSPYYVGSGTLFWPFANNEVTFAGVTLHELTTELDMGSPIIRYKFSHAVGDYYELSNLMVRHAIDSGLTKLSELYVEGKKFDTFNYESDVASKKYVNSDLSEDAIRHVRMNFSRELQLDYDITSG